jgi:hypothetical protein
MSLTLEWEANGLSMFNRTHPAYGWSGRIGLWLGIEAM